MTLPSSRKAGRTSVLVLVLVLMMGMVPSVLSAQTYRQDLQDVLANRPDRPLHKVKEEGDPAPLDIEQVSEIKMVVTGAIRLYQATLSANDMNVCNFWPSCSRFGAASLRQHGVVKGGLLTADRLMRCHGMPTMARYYPRYSSTEKYLDPIEKYSGQEIDESK